MPSFWPLRMSLRFMGGVTRQSLFMHQRISFSALFIILLKETDFIILIWAAKMLKKTSVWRSSYSSNMLSFFYSGLVQLLCALHDALQDHFYCSDKAIRICLPSLWHVCCLVVLWNIKMLIVGEKNWPHTKCVRSQISFNGPWPIK